MQYCTKCKNISEDKITVCPHCKRTRSLRQVKDGDMVTLGKSTEFEAGEMAGIFEENGVRHEVIPYSMGMVSSIYDSEIMPTDKEVFVAYGDIDTAKTLITKEYEEEEDKEEIQDDMPLKKRIFIQVVSVIAFLVLVSLVVFGADWIANSVKSLFS